MLTIKVLGPGCPNCEKVAAHARQAAAMLGVEATIVKVTDRNKFQQYRLLATPGLVINEKLVAGGRIPAEPEIMVWLADALEAAGSQAHPYASAGDAETGERP